MKKVLLIILSIFSLVACIKSIDHIDGATKVDDRVKVYIDNLSNQDILATVRINVSNPVTFGGITIASNTTGSFIEIDFTKNSTEEKGRLYAIDLFVTTSDSAINKYGVANYNKRKDGFYMNTPRPKVILKNSQSTESAFEVIYDSY